MEHSSGRKGRGLEDRSEDEPDYRRRVCELCRGRVEGDLP